MEWMSNELFILHYEKKVADFDSLFKMLPQESIDKDAYKTTLSMIAGYKKLIDEANNVSLIKDDTRLDKIMSFMKITLPYIEETCKLIRETLMTYDYSELQN